jgi:hypothetical protein
VLPQSQRAPLRGSHRGRPIARRVDRAIRNFERLLARLKAQGDGEFSVARLCSLSSQLLTHISSNRGAIIYYGKRYRAGHRVATTLAEPAVELSCRQADGEEGWPSTAFTCSCRSGTAQINGRLRDRLRAPFRQPEPYAPPCSSQTASPASRLTPEKLPVSQGVRHQDRYGSCSQRRIQFSAKLRTRCGQMRPRRAGRRRRSLFRDQQHQPTGNPGSSAPCASARRILRLWRRHRDLGWRRNPEAAAPRHAEADGPHHRLVPHRHEDLADAADRQPRRSIPIRSL